MEQFLKDYGYIISVIIIPIGIWIGSIWYQDRQLKRKAKEELFLKLIANRKAFPIRTEYVDALNKIDVIFQDNTKVRDAWKIYFDSLHPQSPKNANAPTYQIELLSEIAKDLNYKNLTPSELVNFYSPQQFENELYINAQIQNELLRVLTKSQSFSSDVED